MKPVGARVLQFPSSRWRKGYDEDDAITIAGLALLRETEKAVLLDDEISCRALWVPKISCRRINKHSWSIMNWMARRFMKLRRDNETTTP